MNRRQFCSLLLAAILGRKLLPVPAAVAPETGITMRLVQCQGGTRIDVLYGWNAIAGMEEMKARIEG